MIVWGGDFDLLYRNTGGRYCAQSGPTPSSYTYAHAVHGEMYTYAKAASYSSAAALVRSLTNLLSEPNLAQLSAEDSGRYSSAQAKISVYA